jgi:hypothetical protein
MSPTLRKEHRLRVGLSEYRVLRRIFGPSREELPGFWKKMFNELHNVNSS